MTRKKLFILKYSLLVAAYIGLILPTLILFIKNRNIYFVKVDGWSIGMGGAVAVGYALYLAKFGMKKFNPLVGSLIFTLVMYCLDSISEFMFVHAVACTIGIFLFYAFKKPSDYFAKRLETFTNEDDREQAREERALRKQKIAEKTAESGRC